jgi:mannose-1-phosphate guanylyltransferase
VYGVILAGGKGKRFWPRSRGARPKQLLDVTGAGSMLSLTWRRLAAFIPPERIFLLTIEEQASAIHEELPALPPAHIFIEPVGRNTAPSIAVAAELVRRGGGADEPCLVCPADHVIADEDAFRRVAAAAAAFAAEREALVTFGIVPSHPATGYGYIESGAGAGVEGGVSFLEAKRFHEKPDAARAAEYLRAGTYFWNSGIFVWRPSVYLAAWSRFLPEGASPLAAIAAALGTGAERETIAREYPRMPAVSVDYGILEKAGNVVVAPVEFGWSDVGSWDALFGLLGADEAGNAGAGGMELVDCKRNLFFNPGGFTAAVGVDDLVVVVDGGAVLVCRRGESERVREITESLERKNRGDLL